MSENNGEITDTNLTGGPGQAFMHFTIMEELLDKLKVLNYDKEFVKDLKMKAVSRHYFAIQTNPGEQFYLFTSLAAWLIRKCGKPFEPPQEYDDPNSTISSILDAVREFVSISKMLYTGGKGDSGIFFCLNNRMYQSIFLLIV